MAMKKWTKEQEEYLIEIHKNKSNQEIANMINNKFSTQFTSSAIGSKKKKLNLISNYKYIPKYTDEVINFILENYQGRDNIELANLLNEKFNLDTNGDKVGMFKANYKRRFGIDLRTGINRGCFKKGAEPFNKGKKWEDFMSKEGMINSSKTQFKKGYIPPNRREVLEERIAKDGYIEIKIRDGKRNKNWISKHRYIYESVYGEIPEGHKVIFADKDKRNFEISNLILVSNSEELIMNRNKLIFDDKNLTKTGSIIAKVIDKTNKVKNE